MTLLTKPSIRSRYLASPVGHHGLRIPLYLIMTIAGVTCLVFSCSTETSSTLEYAPDSTEQNDDELPNERIPSGVRRVHGGIGVPKGPGWPPSIAIVDTGIDASNSELHVVGGINCATDDRANWGDVDGHGTTLAGVVGAKHNGTGIIGVAPGAELYAVRVFANETLASEENVLCGLRWIYDNAAGIDVALIAFNRPDDHEGEEATCESDELRQILCQLFDAGVTVVAAAGNQRADASSFLPAKLHEVITVGAIADFDGALGGLGLPTCGPGEDDSIANFSNTGPRVDIYAPGVCIQTTSLNSDGNAIDPSGTSLAAAHVAAAAAIYMACHVEVTPSEVRTALLESAETIWSDGTILPTVAVVPECVVPKED